MQPSSTPRWAAGHQRRIVLPLILILLVLRAGHGGAPLRAATTGQGDSSLLFPLQLFDAGDEPRFIVVEDFDQDGRADVAAACAGSRDVFVLRGTGGGFLVPRQRVGVDGVPVSLAAGRLQGHSGSRPAMVVLKAGDPLPTFLFDGPFTGFFVGGEGFVLGDVPPVGGTRMSVAFGNLNTNSRRDLALINDASRDVRHLQYLSSGEFRFANRRVFPEAPAGVATGDLDGDGEVDLAVTHGSQVSIFPTRGLAAFPGRWLFDQERVFEAGPGAGPLAVERIDADDRGDVAVLNLAEGTVGVFLGQGNASLGPRSDVDFQGATAGWFILGDLDGDAVPDLLVPDGDTRSVLFRRGGGDGSFGPLRVSRGIAVQDGDVKDVDGDGRPDLIVARPELDGVVLAPGRGDGTFVTPRDAGGPMEDPRSVAVADFDGDGRGDLAIADAGGSSRIVFGATLAEAEPRPDSLVEEGRSSSAVVAGDFNADGYADLALASERDGEITILPGLGDGRFEAPMRVPTGGHPSALLAGDFDADGRSDLAAAVPGGPSDGAAGAGGVLVFLGRDLGHPALVGPFPVGVAPGDLTSADFDGDGRADLAVANRGSGDVSILPGAGDGTFLPGSRVAAEDAPQAVLGADFDGDGRADLAVALESPGGGAPARAGDTSGAAAGEGFVAVRPGLGDGTFGPARLFPVVGGPHALLAADFNGDPRPDLAIAGQGGAAQPAFLSVLVSLVDGGFAPQFRFDVGEGLDLAAGEFTGDALQDLVIVGAEGVRIIPRLGSLPVDSDADGILDPFDACTDRDGDGLGDPGYPDDTCSIDNCPAHSNPGQEDSDADTVGDPCDPCPRDAQDDVDADGLCADRDNCPRRPNPGQEDGDADRFGDACDVCPGAPDPFQRDTDADGAGDACDLCLLQFDPGQQDADADGKGDVCDNCPDVPNAGQQDEDGDGSGDACQPTVRIIGVRQDGGAVMEARIVAAHPQGRPLEGSLEFAGPVTVELSLANLGESLDCALGYLPEGTPGEGFGFAVDPQGQGVLFDLDGNLGCVDSQPDYGIAPGRCQAPEGTFASLVTLAEAGPAGTFCIRRTGDSEGGIDLSVLEVTPDRLRAAVTSQGRLLLVAFADGLPRLTDISSLPPETRIDLAVTVTDGRTAPVRAAGSFLHQAETELLIGGADPPVAVIAAPPIVECDRPHAGAVVLDGSSSFDPVFGDEPISYEWVADPGGAAERPLGAGAVLETLLPLGATGVGLRVEGPDGLAGFSRTVVVVADTRPPALTLSVAPNILWPPDHRLVPVAVTWQVEDACEPGAGVALLGVASSEADDAAGEGDGRTTGDIAGAAIGSPDDTILLRAERAGGAGGRCYRLVYGARDASGNQAESAAGVAVPRGPFHGVGEAPGICFTPQ